MGAIFQRVETRDASSACRISGVKKSKEKVARRSDEKMLGEGNVILRETSTGKGRSLGGGTSSCGLINLLQKKGGA